MEAKFQLGQKVIVENIGPGVITGIYFQLHFIMPQYQVRVAQYDTIRWHNFLTEDLLKAVDFEG